MDREICLQIDAAGRRGADGVQLRAAALFTD
jgi:hypothetical protein